MARTASRTFQVIPGRVISGRKCEFRLLGLNGKSCGIAVLQVDLGNGKSNLIVAIHPPASTVLIYGY